MSHKNQAVLFLHNKIDRLVEAIGEGRLHDDFADEPDSVAFYQKLELELERYLALLDKIESRIGKN